MVAKQEGNHVPLLEYLQTYSSPLTQQDYVAVIASILRDKRQSVIPKHIRESLVYFHKEDQKRIKEFNQVDLVQCVKRAIWGRYLGAEIEW